MSETCRFLSGQVECHGTHPDRQIEINILVVQLCGVSVIAIEIMILHFTFS